MEPTTGFTALLDFLDALKVARIPFDLLAPTPRAIMVRIAVPGERWEIEFMEDGDIALERFRSTFVERVGNIDTLLDELRD